MGEKMEKNESNEGEIRLSFNTLAAVFLGVLFLLTAFQALQLSELKKEVSQQKSALAQLAGGNPITAASGQLVNGVSQKASSPSGTQTLPQSAQSVPDMVGGC